ncbi:protease inhibitor I42 family protein [Planomonospora sp. ID67723]|uniref:protease inhibitor I42 family protein n=1 Tax=Planomonospora sp. ID67723 TaxID=2738134 RepID=UPI0018C3AD1E|nr:protease inhibitor I42 family protein [Planomonospora sp. ID67723]MBG0829825.1 protease inhibitor I42 family protein [Planomonospora sp. ID67723]
MRYRTGVAALALAGLVTGCGAGSAVYDYGEVVGGGVGRTAEVEVAPGQRFSLAVDENASIGDSWRMGSLPDPKVASFISAEYESESGPGVTGSGGVRYFVFNAKQGGTAVVTLSNCWRCGADRVPADEQSRSRSGDATFRITVK